MFMATTRNDKLMYVVLVAAIVVRVATTLLGERRAEVLPRRVSPRTAPPPAHRPAVAPRTVYGGHEHVLGQIMIALVAGQALAEHENSGEATVHVLHGRV